MDEVLQSYLSNVHAGPSRITRATALATVALSLPCRSVFEDHDHGGFDLWLNMCLRCAAENLKLTAQRSNAEMESELTILKSLITGYSWQDYYEAQSRWLDAANRAQIYLAFSAGKKLGTGTRGDAKRDMLAALTSYHDQIISAGSPHHLQNDGVYLDGDDCVRLSLWLRNQFGRNAGYREYNLAFPNNPVHKPLRFFDVADIGIGVHIGLYTATLGSTLKHGGFKVYMSKWAGSASSSEPLGRLKVPTYSRGELLHFKRNYLRCNEPVY